MIHTNYFVVTDLEDTVYVFPKIEELYRNRNSNPIIVGVRRDNNIANYIIDHVNHFTGGNVDIKTSQASSIMGVITIEIYFKNNR